MDVVIIAKRDERSRYKQLELLSNYIQNRIHELQNPKDCKTTQKIVCTLNKGCGFGCQIHHLSYCMVIALATKRTLILNSQNWRYANKIHGSSTAKSSSSSLWELAFQPLSHTCLNDSGSPRTNWLNSIDHNHHHPRNVQVIDLPILDSLRPRPPYLPLTIPQEISNELTTLHGSPFVWFIGQILRYIMKPSDEIEQFLSMKRSKFNFKHPIVGVHVRRTDKINTEASFHSLSEYMIHVEDYFDRLELFKKRQNDEVFFSLVKNSILLIILTFCRQPPNVLYIWLPMILVYGEKKCRNLKRRAINLLVILKFVCCFFLFVGQY